MARFAAVASLAIGAEAFTQGPSRQAAFLSVQMRPEVAAQSLISVEDEWQAEAQVFANCEANGNQEALSECTRAPAAFKKSCNTVVTAIMHGSSGEKSDVHIYLGDVCGQKILKDWHKERCQSLASAVDKVMTANSYENRQTLEDVDLCTDMWKELLASEKERAEREAEEAKEEEAKRQAEEEARAKAEAEAERKAKEEEEAKEKADAEAKAEAEAKAAEAAKEAEEAKKEALEKLEATKAAQPASLAAGNVTKPAANATKVQEPAAKASKKK